MHQIVKTFQCHSDLLYTKKNYISLVFDKILYFFLNTQKTIKNSHLTQSWKLSVAFYGLIYSILFYLNCNMA